MGSNPALPATNLVISREAQVPPTPRHYMGCNLRDLANAKDTTMEAMRGKTVGIDSFLLAFQFLTTIRDRSPTGDGGPLRAEMAKLLLI